MGQTLVKNYVHIVFSTKHRQPFIKRTIEKELFSYLGAICRNNDCYPVEIGGYIDHVHILCVLSKKITLAKLLEELKSSSSKWIKGKGTEFQNFYWQDGYGAFSVSQKNVNDVINYISNQESHHKQVTFQDELRDILWKNEIDFDERYLWS